MKVYLAGPMWGKPAFNFLVFDYNKKRLESLGYEVISPADLDRAAGYDVDRLLQLTPVQLRAFCREAIVRDIAALLTCDGVFVLEGWQDSKGAAVEVAAAWFYHLPVFDLLNNEIVPGKPVFQPGQESREKPADGRVHYATGAVRSDDREGVRYDLITPIGLRRLAETSHEGAVKYSDYNWERGMPIGDLLNHAIAHLYLYLAGDRGEDHLAHAAWNCLGACHSEEMWPHLNAGLRGPGCAPPATLAEEAANRG